MRPRSHSRPRSAQSAVSLSHLEKLANDVLNTHPRSQERQEYNPTNPNISLSSDAARPFDLEINAMGVSGTHRVAPSRIKKYNFSDEEALVFKLERGKINIFTFPMKLYSFSFFGVLD